MNRSKSAAAVATLALLAGGVGQAHAEQAVSQSLLNVTNFMLLRSDGSVLDLADFTSPYSVSYQITNSAILNGTPSSFGATGSGPHPVDVGMACVGPGCGTPAASENVFLTAAPPPAFLFSRGDTNAFGAPITGTGVSLGLNTKSIAETSLTGGGNAGSNVADILLTWDFALPQGNNGLVLGLRFDVEELMRTWTSPGSTGSSANASFSWELTLKDSTGATLIDWIPDGDIVTGTQVGLTVAAEPCDMTRSQSASFNDPQAAITCSGTTSATSSFGLAANTTYTLSINIDPSTDAVAQVPEPATLALLGLGLAGLGFSRRKQ